MLDNNTNRLLDIKLKNMKKKIFMILAIFVLMNLGQGCRTEHYLIIDIDFNAAFIWENKYKDKQKIVYRCTSTINDKLVFVISYKTRYVSAYIPSLGNVCYALTLPRVNDNSLLRSTFTMTFDKNFTYHGETISAMTNIFEINSITNEIDEYENHMVFCGMGADLVLDFSDNFFKNAVFDTSEEYVVTFSCKTSDDLFFEKTIIINFEK